MYVCVCGRCVGEEGGSNQESMRAGAKGGCRWGGAPLGREALEIGRYGEEREQVALLRLGEMVGVCVNVLICRRVGCVLRRGGCLVGGGGAYLSPRASRTASVRLACRVHRGGNVR